MKRSGIAVRWSDLLGTVNSGFKFTPGQFGLADNGLQSPDTDFNVIWNRDCNCAFGQFHLHDDVATTSADFEEAVFGKNSAYLFTGKNAEFTQLPPQPE